MIVQNDPKFDKLRLYTVGKQFVPRTMLLDLCNRLDVSSEILSQATDGRFSPEFFESLEKGNDADD